MPTSVFDIEAPRPTVEVPRRTAGRPRKDPTSVVNHGVTSIYFGDRIDAIREAASSRGVSMSEFVTDAADVASGIDVGTMERLKALSVLRGVSVAEIVAASLRDVLARARG